MSLFKKSSLFFAVCFLAAVYLSRSFWLSAAAKALIVSEPLESAAIIVVLNGHSVKERMDHAVSLYQKGFARKILVSGSWDLEKETGVNLGRVYLRLKGVMDDDILLENRSRSTRENAVETARFLKENRYDSFILVTSPAHSFRARWMFEKVIPKSIRWISSSDPKGMDPQNWWKNIESCREVFYEYLTIIFSIAGLEPR